MLNYTGRDAILVPWSRIKTCGELSSILRNNKFNGKDKELKDLIFIFEDFDANYSKVLKSRKQTTPNKTYYSSSDVSDDSSQMDITVLANRINTVANEVDTPKEILEHIKLLKEYAANSMNVMNKPPEDELTLEYVLNMFDGIVEQHDAIIVFTTNHLEEIDPAAIRPGRVDYILELKNATVETIKEMIQTKYKLSEEEMVEYKEYFSVFKDYTISPALVQNKCFEYTKNEVVILLNELIKINNA
jgi:SpoVK/Ycf46/Vps4 family AAA+-type ATPase